MSNTPISPAAFTNLIEMLESRASVTAEKIAFNFVGTTCSYGEMVQQIKRFAACLQDIGIGPGDRVVMTLPNSIEFFFAFYGVQKTGAIAVPLFPGFSPERIHSFTRLCGAKLVIVPSTTPAESLAALEIFATSKGLKVITVAKSEPCAGDREFPDIRATDIAFIQYTSGSTGDPKGVQISHDNLLTNMRQMIDGMEITRDDVFVSWLPIYHDMGLILKTMVPFYLGLDLFLLNANLSDVSIWLNTIQTHKATFTAAPDFAYRLCLSQIRNPQDYDLSTLRVALNAAEPVRQQTNDAFETAFGLENVISPAYGLAEATVGVCMWPPGKRRKADSHRHVSVGRPFADVSLKIVKDGQPVEVGMIGEIAIKSTALPIGYFNNPKANNALFWQPDFVLSGDLGYVDEEGDYFIIGRKKNTIIQAGRTINCQEIEEITDAVPVVRYAVALGIDHNRLEGEQVYIFAEIRQSETASQTEYEDIIIAIVNQIHRDLGFRPGRVYLVKPKTIPMTYNGKFQHSRLKKMYLDGNLARTGKILFPDY